MLRRVPPFEACGEAMCFSPWGSTDLTAAKLRPALVIYEGEKDAVVAFISSKIPSELSEVDILIGKDRPGFRKQD
jgi:mRNA interferase MazF